MKGITDKVSVDQTAKKLGENYDVKIRVQGEIFGRGRMRKQPE
jgi:hypothetical protein